MLQPSPAFSPAAFTVIFLLALLATLGLKFWLLARQVRHVGANRERVPAQFAERISLSDHQKAADYTVAKARLAVPAMLIDLGLVLALTLGGGLAAIHGEVSAELDGLTYGVVLIGSVLVLTSLVALPLSIYRQFVVEARFGFNRMTPALFAADLAKQIALAVVIGIPLLYAVLWLMAGMGGYWWLYVWLFWMGFNVLMLWAYPTIIAPLFNKFSPLADPELKARIEGLLARCGFRSNGLFVMDGSKRSSHGNAYFTGLGNNKRIVFFDTLIERLTPTETEAVLAHELGHFRHRHIIKRIVLVFAGALAFLWLLAQLMQTGWFYDGLGITDPSGHNTAMALLLFMLAVPPFVFPLAPLSSLLSRRHEYEADRYAAQHASADELVSALVKLYQDNAATLTPDPVYSTFYDSHPPAALRIRALQNSEAARPAAA
jgi:STE24 endopeptidase